MPIECLISFDNNPQAVYYAGQELSGEVDLSVDTTKRIKAIHITVSGYAKTRWIKKGYPRENERSRCRAYRSYLSSRSYVLGTCASSSYVDWIAGEYSYTFHVLLPDNLPTSFDGKYGQIHYEIITTIDRPGRYPKVFKLPFTVIHPLNLNADTIYRVPLEILDRKRFWSFCCPTGPLTVKFSMPYCGYAPGQKIYFVLYINNESSIDITECDVKLKQEVIYESHDPQHEFRYDKHLIAQRQFGMVLRWSRKVYRGYLSLPSIPPTSAKLSCPINVSYSIKITIRPTDFHCKMKLKIPLTIGTIPILNSGLELNDALLLSQQLQPQHMPYNINNNIDIERDQQVRQITTPLIEEQHNHTQLQHHQTDDNANNTLIVNGNDNPPEYITMMPPSYQEALALSEQFFEDTELLQNISITSIDSSVERHETFKPQYPVYFEYETPQIPPETLYDESPSQLQMMLQVSETSDNETPLRRQGPFRIFNFEKN